MAGAPPNFSWVEEGKVAACGFPNDPEHFDYLKNSGIKHVVALVEMYPPRVQQYVKKFDMTFSVIQIKDFTPPTQTQIDEFLTILEASMMKSDPVVVHCRMGQGRTGTMLACYFVKYYDITGEEAVQKIRDMRPGSIETERQEMAVEVYYQRMSRSFQNRVSS